MNKKLLLFLTIISLLNPYLWNCKIVLLTPLGYVDEVLGVYSIIYIIKQWSDLSKYERRICYCLFCLIIVGLVGTYINKYQTNYFPVLMDIFQCCKCFVVFICCNHIIFNMADGDKLYVIRNINKFLPSIVVVAFIFSILNLIADIGMHDRMRFGIRAFSFLCNKSGTFSDQYFYYLLFLTVGYNITKRKKIYFCLLILASITWMLTLRTRSIVYAPIFILMFYWYIRKNKPFRIGLLPIFILVFLLMTLGAEKINATYQDEESGPRSLFLYYGAKTMVDHVPIGTGFATFGTDMAAKYYSSLYYEYGFDNYWGMNEDDSQFLHDTYWPAIMGQFGIVGVIFVVLIVCYLGREMFKKYKVNNLGLILAMFFFLTRVLNSLAVPAFFSSGCVFMFLIIPLTSLRMFDKK